MGPGSGVFAERKRFGVGKWGVDRLQPQQPFQVIGQLDSGLVAVLRPRLHGLVEDRLQIQRHVGSNPVQAFDVAGLDPAQHLGGGAADERLGEGHRFVEGHAEGVDIGAAVNRFVVASA